MKDQVVIRDHDLPIRFVRYAPAVRNISSSSVKASRCIVDRVQAYADAHL